MKTLVPNLPISDTIFLVHNYLKILFYTNTKNVVTYMFSTGIAVLNFSFNVFSCFINLLTVYLSGILIDQQKMLENYGLGTLRISLNNMKMDLYKVINIMHKIEHSPISNATVRPVKNL